MSPRRTLPIAAIAFALAALLGSPTLALAKGRAADATRAADAGGGARATAKQASKAPASTTKSSASTTKSSAPTTKSSASTTKSSPPAPPSPAATATPKSPGAAPLSKGEIHKRLKASPFLEVRARDLSLTEASMERLLHIAKRYHEATHRHLVVTGGTRNAQRQAELMCAKLDHHEDVIALYENKRLAREIVDAYQKGLADKLGKSRIVRAVRARIEEQIGRGEFISRHLQSGAADVRSRGMSAAQQVSFRKAVSEEPGASILDERDGAAPHFHINL